MTIRVYRDMSEAELPEPEYRQAEFWLSAMIKNKNWERRILLGRCANKSSYKKEHKTGHKMMNSFSGIPPLSVMDLAEAILCEIPDGIGFAVSFLVKDKSILNLDDSIV